jgi:hypothetical protein
MNVNQRGEPIREDCLSFPFDLEPGEAEKALFLLLEHLNLTLWRTNATKHGVTELMIRPVD